MKPWKPAYVELLRQNIEEYRHVKFIDNRRRKTRTVSQSVSQKKGTKSQDSHGTQKKTKGINKDSESDWNSNAKLPLGSKWPSNKEIMNSPKEQGDVVTKRKKSVRRYQIKTFVEKEDKVLRKAIRQGKEGNIVLLARKLNRSRASVRDRIEKIKTGVYTREYKAFTLQEDLVIIDAAVEHFSQVKSIKKTNLLNHKQTAESLQRNSRSVYHRWEKILKVWLLSHQSKTLNLDVRLMLANVLVDNFDSISSIDWGQVSNCKEFSGDTEVSLRGLFFAYMMKNAAEHFKVDRSKLTLRQVAEAAEVAYSSGNVMRVSGKIEERQIKIIEYFEKCKLK